MKKRKKNRFLFILLFVILSPIILIELVIKGLKKLIKRKISASLSDKDFYELLSIEKVDIMDGITFEQFLKRLFIYKGYQVSETPRTGDFGADLILKKDGLVTVVQAKRYSGNVGAKAIQEIYSARAHYHADKMMVISSAHFTRQAEVMANEQSIELIDREELMEEIEEVKEIIKNTMTEKDKETLEQKMESSLDNFKFRI